MSNYVVVGWFRSLSTSVDLFSGSFDDCLDFVLSCDYGDLFECHICSSSGVIVYSNKIRG